MFVTQVKSIEKGPMVNMEIVSKDVTCLGDAVALSKKVVRSIERRLHPRIGDIICVTEDDPTDIYKQVLFAIVKRGKV